MMAQCSAWGEEVKRGPELETSVFLAAIWSNATPPTGLRNIGSVRREPE